MTKTLLIDRRTDIDQSCLRTLVDVPAGAIIVSFADSAHVDTPSYLTVQLDEDVHLALTPPEVQYVNHSCAPNVSFDMERLALVALTDLSANDELTYAYPSTEWRMSRPFECACGAMDCLGTVNGAWSLSARQLSRYALSPYIRKKIALRDAPSGQSSAAR